MRWMLAILLLLMPAACHAEVGMSQLRVKPAGSQEVWFGSAVCIGVP